jgi:hypothetical protein
VFIVTECQLTYLTWTLTLKMGPLCSSIKSEKPYGTTWCFITEFINVLFLNPFVNWKKTSEKMQLSLAKQGPAYLVIFNETEFYSAWLLPSSITLYLKALEFKSRKRGRLLWVLHCFLSSCSHMPSEPFSFTIHKSSYRSMPHELLRPPLNVSRET